MKKTIKVTLFICILLLSSAMFIKYKTFSNPKENISSEEITLSENINKINNSHAYIKDKIENCINFEKSYYSDDNANDVVVSTNKNYYRQNFEPTIIEKQEIIKPYMIGEFMLIDDEYNDNWYFSEKGLDFGYLEDYFPALDYLHNLDDITATSSLSNDFLPENITSTNRLLSWSEGVSGDGIDQKININNKFMIFNSTEYIYNDNNEIVDIKFEYETTEDEQIDIFYNTICIVNGYAKNDQSFIENNRVKDLALYINDEYYGILKLEDTINPQYFELKDITAKTMENTKFTFEIKDIYKGTKYDDTCLTGIKFGFNDEWHLPK